VAASSDGAAVAAAPSSSAAEFIPAAAPSSLLFRLTPSSFHPYLLLARADKPVGTWLLLLPCLWSLGLAAAPGTLIDLKLAAVMAVGAFVMRGAGSVTSERRAMPGWKKQKYDRLNCAHSIRLAVSY
jgi:4-hydroxybenzoate polyprenyltransferase